LLIVVGTFQQHEARIKTKNEANVEATQVNGIGMSGKILPQIMND
jgi:hypothetical protein